MHHSDEALYPSICSQPVAGEGAVTIAAFYAESCPSMRTPLGLHQRARSSMWGYRRHTPSANDIAFLFNTPLSSASTVRAGT